MTEEALAQAEQTSAEQAEQAQAPTEETGQPEEAATSEQGQETDDKPKEQKSGFQKRIDQLTREKYQIQQQYEQERAAADQLRQAAMQAQLQQSGDIPMPKLADFGYDEEQYGAAVQQWHQAKIQAQTEQQTQLAQHQAELQRQHQRQAALNTKLGEATTKYPDFMVKVQNPELPSLQQMSPAAFEAVIESDNFADVSYYLANNPAELYEFANLTPIQAIRRVTGIEAKLSQKPVTTHVPPAPPSTVGGKGEVAKDPTTMTTEEYIAWRNSKDPRVNRK